MTEWRLAAAGLIVAYLAVAAFMYFRQRDLQYFPANKGLTPQAVGLAGVEVVKLTASDGVPIIAWYAPAKPGHSTILYFHGNAGEIGDRAERLAAYQGQGTGALFVSYRGYGGSGGTPTEAGLIDDARAGYDWLMQHGVAPRDTMVVGESLGTGVAVRLAAEREVGAVALEAPFASAVDIAARLYWWLPVRLLMKDQFRSIDHAGGIHVPLLVIHGEKDDLIPLSEGKRLFTAANEPKEMVVVSGGSHESIFGPETWALELAFFERVRGK